MGAEVEGVAAEVGWRTEAGRKDGVGREGLAPEESLGTEPLAALGRWGGGGCGQLEALFRGAKELAVAGINDSEIPCRPDKVGILIGRGGVSLDDGAGIRGEVEGAQGERRRVEAVGRDPDAVLQAAQAALAKPAPEAHAECGLVSGEVEEEEPPLSVPGALPAGGGIEAAERGGAAFGGQGDTGITSDPAADGQAGAGEGAELGAETVTRIPAIENGTELPVGGVGNSVEEGEEEFGKVQGGGVRVHGRSASPEPAGMSHPGMAGVTGQYRSITSDSIRRISE